MTIDLTDKHIGVILPEGQDRVVILARRKLFYNVRPDNVLFSGSVELPPGNWKILCDSKSMTEEQAVQMVEITYDQDADGTLYKHYGNPATKIGDGEATILGHFDPIESFRSLVESKGYYLENPLGKEPDTGIVIYHEGIDCDYSDVVPNPAYKRWQEAESKVIGLLVVLEKV